MRARCSGAMGFARRRDEGGVRARGRACGGRDAAIREYWALMYGRFTQPAHARRVRRGAWRRRRPIFGRPKSRDGRITRSTHAGLLGTVKLELGAFHDSREEFEALLANWDEERDRALRAVTGADVLCVGMGLHGANARRASARWKALCECPKRRCRRAEALDDFGARRVRLEPICRLRRHSRKARRYARARRGFAANWSPKKARALWELNARGYAVWARGLLQRDPAAAANEMGEVIAAKLERKELMVALPLARHARRAAKRGRRVRRRAHVRREGRWNSPSRPAATWMDSILHRVRGDILARRDRHRRRGRLPRSSAHRSRTGRAHVRTPSRPALAKLYQSTNRAADAHAVLSPALEGFSPTPEFPEIAEAQALLLAAPAS